MDADVVGLMEIENDGYGPYSAIQDLVNGLNDALGAGTYAFIDPGVAQIGTDEIAVGLIYKPGTVTPVGASPILDSSVDPIFLDTKNRPGAGPDLRAERQRRAAHRRRQPPQVQGLGLRRRGRPRHWATARATAT